MIAKNKLVVEIIEELNQAVRPIINAKVQFTSYPERKGCIPFHETIKELSDPVLKEYGLDINTWRVDFLDYEDQPKELSYEKRLIEYNQTLDKDKRTKYSVGKITSLWFECSVEINSSTTLGDLIRTLTIESIEDRLKSLREHLAEKQKEIYEGQKTAGELLVEFNRLHAMQEGG